MNPNITSTSEARIVPQTELAIQFLQKLRSTGPWHLVSIFEEKIEARSFYQGQEPQLRAWIDARQGRKNLYYHVNTVRSGFENKKASKKDIDVADYLHVDIDGPQALEVLRISDLPEPTAVILSGGGVNALWRLQVSSSDLALIERINAAIARPLGGDNCHNIDRILRLPGTINVPDARKRARGRVETLAIVVEDLTDWTRSYPLSHLEDIAGKLAAHHIVEASAVAPIGLDQLPPIVPPATIKLIQRGDDPDRPIGTVRPRYRSRSEAVFRVACDLARAGCSGETIAGILINRAHGISSSILEKKTPEKYAARQAASALDAVSKDWPDRTKKGMPAPTFRNALLALRRLGLFGEFDEFHNRKILGGTVLDGYDGDLSDDQCARLRQTIITEFEFDPGKEKIRDAANTLCLDATYHPIRDYLAQLIWDGKPRLGAWLATYLGAANTLLNQAIGRIMLIAAVRRVRQPGVKYDTIVVLEGVQGTGKSTALKILAGGDANFSDQEILTLSPKEQMEALEGVWIYEICELEGISRAETTKVKAFASRSIDQGRPAYAYFKEKRPRQCILVGTTNENQYLRDMTGNRRFWPVATGTIDLEKLACDRDQLWAEAAYWEEKGESLVLPSELWPLAQAEQDARLEGEPWLDLLANVKGQPAGLMERIATTEIFETVLEVPKERRQQFQEKRVANLMKKLGWVGPKSLKVKGKTLRGYERPLSSESCFFGELEQETKPDEEDPPF
jgi:hypothetical protein